MDYPSPVETCSSSKVVGTSLTLGFCDWPSEEAARGLQSSRCGNFATLRRVDGYLGRRFTKTRPPRASLAMATRIPQTRPHLSEAQRCASQKQGLSTALSARLMESASVQSKSWAGWVVLPARRRIRHNL